MDDIMFLSKDATPSDRMLLHLLERVETLERELDGVKPLYGKSRLIEAQGGSKSFSFLVCVNSTSWDQLVSSRRTSITQCEGLDFVNNTLWDLARFARESPSSGTFIVFIVGPAEADCRGQVRYCWHPTSNAPSYVSEKVDTETNICVCRYIEGVLTTTMKGVGEEMVAAALEMAWKELLVPICEECGCCIKNSVKVATRPDAMGHCMYCVLREDPLAYFYFHVDHHDCNSICFGLKGYDPSKPPRSKLEVEKAYQGQGWDASIIFAHYLTPFDF